jgi:hypothetical protein
LALRSFSEMTLSSTAGIILFGAVFSFGHPFA